MLGAVRAERLLLISALSIALWYSPGRIIAQEQIYEAGNGVTPPKLIHKVQPHYTKQAKKDKLEGLVTLAMVVNSSGVPENISVKVSLDPGLDAEAIKGVSKWRFEPARKNGIAVAVKATAEIKFRLCCGW
jgi:protein TonB